VAKPLRILRTEILPWRFLQDQSKAGLGFPIEFQQQDFITAQRMAAMSPESYDQCFHNLDIVWHWRAIQPIDVQRITTWDEMTGLACTIEVNGRAALVDELAIGVFDLTMGLVSAEQITVRNIGSMSISEIDEIACHANELT
jgi:hypothetical protein